MSDSSSALMVVDGKQGAIQLQTTSLPDVRTLLTDGQRKEARQMAMQANISDTRALLDFGQTPQMSELAQKIAGQVQIRDTRGSPVEEAMVDLGLIHKKLDPSRVIHPKVAQSFKAALTMKSVFQAYIEDYQKVKKPLDALKQRLEKLKQEQGLAITSFDQLGRDAYVLYDQYTVLEGAMLYLIQRMVREYEQRKTAMRPDDLKEAQALAELADTIGMMDRSTFELHYSRARAIEIAQSTKVMQQSAKELYRMFASELLTKLPLFEIELAEFITVLQSQKALDALNAYREAEAKQGEAMDKAMNQLAVGVANASNASVNDIQRLVNRYENITNTMDQVMKIHEDGRQARQTGEAQLNQLMDNMQRKIGSYDPTKLLRAPDDVKDVPLSLDK
jgi:uncharacterized protein YaaN involved in tellurite resistance